MFLIKLVAAPVLTVMLACSASGQQALPPVQPGQVQQPVQVPPQGQVLPPTFSPPLVQNPLVRRELRLSDPQYGRLNDALSRVSGQIQVDVGPLNKLDEPARGMRLRQLGLEFNNQVMQSAGNVLNDQQMGRFRQLEIQRAGFGNYITPGTFESPDVLRQLNLTADQRQQLQALSEQTAQEGRGIFADAATNRELAAQRFNELQTKYWDQVNGFLNEQQRQTWSELTGNRFLFAPDLFPPAATAIPR